MASDNQSKIYTTVTQNSNKIAIHLIQYTTNRRGYKRYEFCSLLNILYCSQLPWSAVIFSCLVVQLETLQPIYRQNIGSEMF